MKLDNIFKKKRSTSSNKVSQKGEKTPGPGDLPADVLKLIEEQHLGALTSLFSKIYETGITPEE